MKTSTVLKMIMYYVKIGQDLCAPALQQALPFSVTCGHIYITAQHLVEHFEAPLPNVPASVHITGWSQHKLDLNYNNCSTASSDMLPSLEGGCGTGARTSVK